MKYSYEFKLRSVEKYRLGEQLEIPKGAAPGTFRKRVREWVRMVEANGPEVLRHKNQDKVWTAEEKYELVAKVLAGASCSSTAINAGINAGLLYSWVRRYKIEGYEGLSRQRKGRPPKEPEMKKKEAPTELTPSEREEMILMKAEIEQLKAENEAIKKLIALRHKEWDEQLKAKKRCSSRNSAKKDTN